MPTSVRFIAWFVVLGIAGCGGPPAGPVAVIEKVVPVSGSLTYEGKPLEGYQVTFVPTDGRRPAAGVTDAAGKFTLGTNAADDGCPPGSHKVSVVWVAPTTGEPGMEPIIDDPAKLPKPKIQIPKKYENAETSGLTQEVPSGGLQDLKIDLK